MLTFSVNTHHRRRSTVVSLPLIFLHSIYVNGAEARAPLWAGGGGRPPSHFVATLMNVKWMRLSMTRWRLAYMHELRPFSYALCASINISNMCQSIIVLFVNKIYIIYIHSMRPFYVHNLGVFFFLVTRKEVIIIYQFRLFSSGLFVIFKWYEYICGSILVCPFILSSLKILSDELKAIARHNGTDHHFPLLNACNLHLKLISIPLSMSGTENRFIEGATFSSLNGYSLISSNLNNLI